MDESEVTYSYRWVVNGETVVGEEDPSLPSRFFRRGDKVQVAAIPFDGTDWGPANSSMEIKAEDVDGDTLRFYLKGETPKGMTIDSKAGVVEWQVEMPETPVTYNYEVIAEDSGGAKSIQKITLKNTP